MGDPGTTGIDGETAGLEAALAEADREVTEVVTGPEPVELGPQEVIDRVTRFFSIPTESLFESEGGNPRLSDIKGLAALMMQHDAGLTRTEAAAVLQRSAGNFPRATGRARKLLAKNKAWRGYYRDLIAETPPSLPLMDRYVAGFCHEYGVTPGMLEKARPKEFLRKARHGLICRLVQETPIPLRQIRERFLIDEIGEAEHRAERFFAADPEAAQRIRAVEPRDEAYPFSDDPEAIIEEVLDGTGFTMMDIQDRDQRTRYVSEVRRQVIGRLYFQTSMEAQEIAALIDREPEYVGQVVAAADRPERGAPVLGTPERRCTQMIERFQRFFGIPIDGRAKQSGPDAALIDTLVREGMSQTDAARATGRKRIASSLEQMAGRMENPFFRRMIEAERSGIQPPGEKGMVNAVLEACALRAGTDVETLLKHPRTESGLLARDWATYLLRRHVGLKVRQVRDVTGIRSLETIRRGLERLTEEVERSEETAAVERFMWRCLLRDHRPHEADDAVLYFPTNGGRKAAIGKVAEVHEEDEGRLLVIDGRNGDPEYTVFDGDPTVVDAESAAVIIRDPRLLDVWLFSHEVGAFTRKRMREALDRRCKSGPDKERQAK